MNDELMTPVLIIACVHFVRPCKVIVLARRRSVASARHARESFSSVASALNARTIAHVRPREGHGQGKRSCLQRKDGDLERCAVVGYRSMPAFFISIKIPFYYFALRDCGNVLRKVAKTPRSYSLSTLTDPYPYPKVIDLSRLRFRRRK